MLLDGGRVGVEGNLLSYFFYLQSKVSRAKYVIKKPPPPAGARMGRLKSALATVNCL